MLTLAMKPIGLILLSIIVLSPITNTTSISDYQPDNVFYELNNTDTSQYIISDVPYVWQEINGLCAWAALTILFQHMGINVTLDQILDVSGVGFAFYYLRADPTLLFYPGPLGSQIPDTQYLADTFGLDVTWYFGEDTEGIGQLKSVIEQQGMNVTVLSSFVDGLDQLKREMANNTPLLISVNPLRFSTIRDYQILDLPPDTIAAHGVVAIGYNDTHIFINDPGVGSFGPDYGYPTDKRGIAAPIPIEDFQLAWQDRSLFAMKLHPRSDYPQSDEFLRSQTIERIISKLEGDYRAYAYAPFTMWLGADAFVQMGNDLQPSEFEAMLTSWDVYFGDRTQLVNTLPAIKSAYLGSLSLTYEAMNRAATDLFTLLHGLSQYTPALNSLTKILSDFETLVDSAVLKYSNDESKRTLTLFDNIFDLVVQALNEGKSIEQAIQTAIPHLEALSLQIANIGDSLTDFSSSLKAIHSTSTKLNIQSILQITLLGGVIVIMVVIVKRKVQHNKNK